MDTVPQDLWPLIASFMDNKTKRQMRLANTKWFNTIKYYDFTLYFTTKEDIPIIIERLSKYLWPIELTFNKAKFTNTVHLFEHLYLLTNLKNLKNGTHTIWKDDTTDEQWMRLSGLKNIEEWQYLYQYLPVDLWKQFTKLTYWDGFGDEEELTPILKNLSHLHSLKFFGRSTTFPFALVPNPEKLTRIHLNLSSQQQFGKEIWFRLTNLKHLSILDRGNSDLELSHLTNLTCFCWTGASVPSLAANTQLKTLKLPKCQSWPLHSIEALTNLKKLQKMEIIVPEDADVTYCNLIATLVSLRSLTVSDRVTERNKNYMQTFSALTNLQNLCFNECAGDYQFLTNFSNLTKLQVTPFLNCQNLRAIETMTNLQELAITLELKHDEVPDLARLSKLTSLCCFGNHYPINAFDGLKHLTNLLLLSASPQDFNFLVDLTKLTYLSTGSSPTTAEFWSNVVKLTNMKHLAVKLSDDDSDCDDRLLALTVLSNLTNLELPPIPAAFNGRHFTALTSLHNLCVLGHGSQLVHRKELLQRMPYLYEYSFFEID